MMAKLKEEEMLRKLAAQKAFNAKMLKKNKKSANKNQTAMSQEDVGFFQGLLGRSSEEEQRRLAGNMYPGPQLSLFDRAKNALGDAWTNDNSSYKQGIWANNQIDAQELEQEKARAAAASAADQQAGSGQLAQQLWSPGLGAPNHQPTVKAAVEQGVTGVVPRGQFNSSQGKQLSDADFAAMYSQPVQTNKEIAKYGAGNTGLINQNAQYGYMGLGDMLGNLQYNQDGTFKRLPTLGTRVGDALRDAGNYAKDWSVAGRTNGMGPEQWANSEITRQEDERAYNSPEAIANRADAANRESQTQAGIWADQQIDSQVASQAVAQAEQSLMAQKEQEAAGLWANQQITQQETEQRAAIQASEEAKQARMAQIQAGIDADAGRTNQENYELASGVDRAPAQMTAASISESIAETFELAETAVDAEASGTTIDLESVVGKEKADILSEWAKGSGIGDTFKSWGSVIMDKFGFAGDDQELTEVEIDNIIAVKDELVPNAGQDGLLVGETTSDENGLLTNGNTGGATHTMPDGTVMPGATHPTSTATSGTTGANTTSSSPVNTSVFNATASSTEGFTMDRLKNPLSADNKAWWLGGGGGVPGNNRAKEFFDTLAYIGTPMKYRPAKTPSQQGMENRIAQQNNVMDYNSSMASANKSTAPSFAALRAAIPSYAQIKDGVTGSLTADFDSGWSMSSEEQAQLDSQIANTATAVRQRMIEMTLTTGSIPNMQNVIKTMIKEQDAKDAEIERLKEEEKARIEALKPTTESSSWWSDVKDDLFN